jgi:hypothetical protein
MGLLRCFQTERFNGNFLTGDEDDPDKPVPDVMRLPKEGKLFRFLTLIVCYAVRSYCFEVKDFPVIVMSSDLIHEIVIVGSNRNITD